MRDTNCVLRVMTVCSLLHNYQDIRERVLLPSSGYKLTHSYTRRQGIITQKTTPYILFLFVSFCPPF